MKADDNDNYVNQDSILFRILESQMCFLPGLKKTEV